MDTCNVLNYLQRREYGFTRSCNGFRQNICANLIEKMRCQLDYINNLDIDIGSTFSCKFSKNNNNLHIIACSTENGDIIIQDTFENDLLIANDGTSYTNNYVRGAIHTNAIFNLAWAETKMKLVTGSGDQTSKIIHVLPSGKMEIEREFNYNSSVKSVMFCPGSSDVFCGGTLDGSIKVWDARVNHNRNVLGVEHHIPNTHGVYKHINSKKTFKNFGVCSVVFQNDLNIISCSSNDPAIKIWDLRKSYRQVKANTESLALKKYGLGNKSTCGFVDIILNPRSSCLFASGMRNVIFCFSLDSTQTTPIHSYTGHYQETHFSRISVSHDNRYIFSGCTNKTGVIWTTDLPHIEKPVFQLNQKLPVHTLTPHIELSVSDWCADPTTHPKLITSSDSMPLLWSVLTKEVIKSKHKFIKTPEGKLKKSFSNNICTAPIKLNVELEEELRKETDEHMKDWDLKDKNLVLNTNIKTSTSKKPWEILFTKTKLLSPQLLPKSNDSSIHQQIPEVVTPKSQKRKKSNLSPKSLIDHYLIPTKREKLDTVKEI